MQGYFIKIPKYMESNIICNFEWTHPDMLDRIRLMFEKTTRPNRRQRYLLENATIQLLHEQTDIERWKDLIRTHHYLRSSNVAGKALRYVVEVGGSGRRCSRLAPRLTI